MFTKKGVLSRFLFVVLFLLGFVFLFSGKAFAQTPTYGCVSPGTWSSIYFGFDGVERRWLYHCGELNFAFQGAFAGPAGPTHNAEVMIKKVGQPDSAYVVYTGLYATNAVDGNPNAVGVVGRLGLSGFGGNACIPPGDYDLMVRVFNEDRTQYCSRTGFFRVVATLCNGEDSKWLVSPEGRSPIVPSPTQKLVSSAEIGNKAGNGWGTFNLYLNGWLFSCPIAAGTSCSGESGSTWEGTTVRTVR